MIEVIKMKRITLAQLLQYADPQTEPKIDIQIVMPDEEWDWAVQLWVGSELLKPCMNLYIAEIGYEKSYFEDKPLIRVSLERECGEE